MLERRAASGGENPKNPWPTNICEHKKKFDRIKGTLEVFPMGYKLLKTKTLVLENGHLWNKMMVGFSHLA